MPITLIRVINQQTINRSILLDKLDDGQANTIGYAHLPRNKVYVPYQKSLDINGLPLPSPVKGYIDLCTSDRVLLSVDRGTIHGLTANGKINSFAFSSALKALPVISAASNAAGTTTIDGTTFLSVTPDVTYVVFENLLGATQTIASSHFASFTTLQITIADLEVTIGTPTTGWKVKVKANSSTSAEFTMT